MTAAEFLPTDRSLDALRSAACTCKGCSLWEHATQTVFGEGADGARVMLVGEQPGDQEDRKGRPFVGPAGRLAAEGLQVAGRGRRVVVSHAAVYPGGGG